MEPLPSILKPRRLEPPLRRVLAVDAGSRCIRLLLLESRFGQLRLLQQKRPRSAGRGPCFRRGTQGPPASHVAEWGRPPLALALPQYIAVSQIVDLPPVPDAEARQLIEAETIKLGGVSESVMVYDFVRVPLLAENRQSFWVTFCPGRRNQSRITQLGLDEQEFREITTDRQRPAHRVALGCNGGTGRRARSRRGAKHHPRGPTRWRRSFRLQLSDGGRFFHAGNRAPSRAFHPQIADESQTQHQSARRRKALPGFAGIRGWLGGGIEAAVERMARATGRQPRRFIATGGAFEQPGLREYLAQHALD